MNLKKKLKAFENYLVFKESILTPFLKVIYFGGEIVQRESSFI